MKTTTKAPGPQGSIQKTRTRNVANVANDAHPSGPVRRRTRPQVELCSLRHPGGYESTETQTHSKQCIPPSITASEGRNDKIHVVCDIATVICDDKDDARSFVLHCGAAPKDQRNEHELFSKLFNTAPLNGDGNKLEIRYLPVTYGKKVYQAPWVTGKLCFRRLTRHDGKIAVIVTADLCLNVNRALNHQRAALAKGRKDAIFQSFSPVALGVCGKDNLAPFDLAQGEHDNARKLAFDFVTSAIHADVRRAAETAGEAGCGYLSVSGKPCNFSLREVETCWDIGGTGLDAVQALADITPALIAHGGKRGWIGNAGTVTIEFSKWERLVVYAKAPDRLRFEIRHRPTHGNRPYCSDTLADNLDKLDSFRTLATAKTNAILSSLKSLQAASRTGSEREAYAMAWGACCGNSEASKALFQILRQLGRIQGGKCVECIESGGELLRKARDADLIAHSNGAYRPIFSNDPKPALTELDISSAFAGHNTETHPVVSVPKSPTPIRKRNERESIPPCPLF